MNTLDFNRDWTVRRDGDEQVHCVDLPHDAMLFEERSRESTASGACGYFYGGKYIYKKTWEVPADWAGKHVVLECEGVYKNAEVLLNGEKVAFRPYGYTDFYVDLSGRLLCGAANHITIIADNSETPNSRWYSGSGIYREVRLHVGGEEHIDPQGIRVDVTGPSSVRVAVKGCWAEDTEVLTEILYDGVVVASGTGNPTGLYIPEPHLWDAENPNLYTCRAKLVRGGQVLDEAQTTFGLRQIVWGGGGLHVNGKKVLLRGACIHHDNGILGACAFRDAEFRRVRILKEAGFNAIRSAHNPVSKAMLDACDQLGMYVMDETFDMWMIQKTPFDYGGETFREWWQQDTAAMIEKDRNHPSVIMYSIGNEISDLGQKEGMALCREMTDYVHALDDSRPVTLGVNLMLATLTSLGAGLYGKDKDGNDKNTGAQAIDSAPTSTFFNMMMNRVGTLMDLASATIPADRIAKEVASVLDIAGYNYATSRYRKEAKRSPEKAFVGSETLPKSLYANWQLVEKIPNLIGDFMWTGWDYLGESAIGTIQYKDPKTKEDVEEGLIVSGGAGVIDICGKKRAEVGWDKAIWGLSDRPVIAVDPLTHVDDFAVASMWRDTDAVESWSWYGYAGRKTNVTVYSNAHAVELFVNGKSLGMKNVKACKAVFRGVTYRPGHIEAAAYDKGGQEISRSELFTAKGKTAIRLTPEKTVLTANGQDLCFLNIDLAGRQNGVTRSSSDQKLTVTVEGAGTLQAFGSARPNMAENFVSDTHTTYYGKALAVIRAGYEPGEIKVSVRGEGLETAQIVISVKS